jgi:C1A family cysteine protease
LNHQQQYAEFELGRNPFICPSEPSIKLTEQGLGKKPEEMEFPTAWFDPDVHFFTKDRLREFGLSLKTVPEAFDWTDYWKDPIKDQGDEGSCWTFSSANTAEAALWVRGRDHVRVSTQQLLDCLHTHKNVDGNWCYDGDCGYVGSSSSDAGGFAEDAMKFFSKYGFRDAHLYPYKYGICKDRQELPPGVENTMENLKAHCEATDYCAFNHAAYLSITESDYYVHRARQFCQNVTPVADKCRMDLVKPAGYIKGIVLVSYDPVLNVYQSDGMHEDMIAEAVYKLGPVSIQMNALSILRYRGGIMDFSAEQCDQRTNDHLLQIVGWGTENGIDYWKIRNSWGPFYGENGFLRIRRGNNVCGVAMNVFAAYV